MLMAKYKQERDKYIAIGYCTRLQHYLDSKYIKPCL